MKIVAGAAEVTEAAVVATEEAAGGVIRVAAGAAIRAAEIDIDATRGLSNRRKGMIVFPGSCL